MDKLTVGEIRFIDYQNGRSGSFYTCLFRAIERADMENQKKLKLGFPSEVEAYQRYSDEHGYWEEVQRIHKASIGSQDKGSD